MGTERGLTQTRQAAAGQKHLDGKSLAFSGGLHPPYENACPDPFYFGYSRPEVVALNPDTARRVLDIGCGDGRLGEAIKRRQQVSGCGIE